MTDTEKKKPLGWVTCEGCGEENCYCVDVPLCFTCCLEKAATIAQVKLEEGQSTKVAK